MDFTSIVFIQIAIFSCVVVLGPTSRSSLSLKLAAIVTLALVALSWYFVPQQMISIGGGAWLGLFLLPTLLVSRLNSLVAAAEYLAASRLARRLRWLLPSDGMWTYHHLLRGLALAQTGEIAAADEIFDRYQQDDRTELGRSATALLYRSTERWVEYVAWVKHRLTSPRRLQLVKIERSLPPINRARGMTLVYYVRALAEIGDISGCIAEATRLERDRQIDLQQLQLVRMYILAFCGRAGAVAQCCQRLLAMYPPTVHQFWIATAELAAGHCQIAKQQLGELQQQVSDRSVRADIEWRLSHSLPTLAKLTATEWESVNQMEIQTAQEIKYNSQAPTDVRTPATTCLIALNVLVYCAELFWQYRTGTTQESFIAWGGLVAPLVVAGQWWRIVTANFLHLGILHLALNMFALLYLGKFVEYRLGTLRFTIAYVVAGLGSMAMITYVDTRWLTEPQVTVGASGAIMGMLGTMGAIHLIDWGQGKARAAARQLQTVLFSVGLQLIFDLTNGHTSIVGHFSGLLVGFVVGLLLLLKV